MMHRFLQKLIASIGLMLLVCCSTNAATPGVGVTLINYTFDTVEFGYTITLNTEVKNFDTIPFTGTIDFGLRNNQGTLTNSGVFNQPPYSGNQISLYPGEVVPAVFSIRIDPQYFAPGPDVVVVWPICSGPIADSVVLGILVETPSAINDKTDDLFSYIIFSDRIFVKNTAPGTNFKQVRIYNLLGQQTHEQRGEFITEVQLPALPKGLYLCEFVAADGKRKVVKFFH